MNSEFRVLVRPAPESTAICPPEVKRRRICRKTCLSMPKEQEVARKAYKPDSVPVAKQAMTIPLTAPLPMRLQLPTRTCWGRRAPPLTRRSAARGPYLALLPVGLAVPELLPAPRWALTPPFHPYPSGIPASRTEGRFLFCGAFRRVAPPGRYPAPFLLGVWTFLYGAFAPQKRRRGSRTEGAMRADVGHATRVDAAAIQPSAPDRPRRGRAARQWARGGRQDQQGREGHAPAGGTASAQC